jgi:hypothetical protein
MFAWNWGRVMGSTPYSELKMERGGFPREIRVCFPKAGGMNICEVTPRFPCTFAVRQVALLLS